jgi:hypothetical protein
MWTLCCRSMNDPTCLLYFFLVACRQHGHCFTMLYTKFSPDYAKIVELSSRVAWNEVGGQYLHALTRAPTFWLWPSVEYSPELARSSSGTGVLKHRTSPA